MGRSSTSIRSILNFQLMNIPLHKLLRYQVHSFVESHFVALSALLLANLLVFIRRRRWFTALLLLSSSRCNLSSSMQPLFESCCDSTFCSVTLASMSARLSSHISCTFVKPSSNAWWFALFESAPQARAAPAAYPQYRLS